MDSNLPSGPETIQCALCRRQIPAYLITLHHLTPRQKGGKPEHRTPLCKPCHKQLHALFSNTELARIYPTLQSLLAAPQIRSFLKWIRKQPSGSVFVTRTSNANPEARRRRSRRLY